MDASVVSSLAPSRTGTGLSLEGFGSPLHQDSGFNEPSGRISYESERIRQILEEEDMADLALERGERRIEERLWDEKDGTLIGEGVRGSELVVGADRGQREAEYAKEKALEEKVSNTTIRPPSIMIPEFAHAKAVEVSPPAKSEAPKGEEAHRRGESGHLDRDLKLDGKV